MEPRTERLTQDCHRTGKRGEDVIIKRQVPLGILQDDERELRNVGPGRHVGENPGVS